jgi:hypothetical protein
MSNKSILIVIFLIAFNSAKANQIFDYIKTNSGKEFKNFTILGQDPSSIKIEHEFGTAKIRLEDLPDDWKAKFNYDYESSKKYEERVNELIREKNQKDLIEKKLANDSIKIRGRVLQKLQGGLLIINARILKQQMVIKPNVTTKTSVWERDGVASSSNPAAVMDEVEENFSNGIAYIESKSEITDKLYENSECLFDFAWQVGQYEYSSNSGNMVVPKLCITKEEAFKYYNRK